MRGLALSLLAGLLLTLATSCGGNKQALVTNTASITPAVPAETQSLSGSALIQPENGGVVGLSSGAEVVVPPGAVPNPMVVSLRQVESSASTPVPRTILGSAYDLSLDGGQLTGVARLRLPFPAEVTPAEYDIAAYRWNGRAWERIGGRVSGDALEVATTSPGVFALQGTWRMADASVALALPSPNPEAGDLTIPFTVAGQYRFSVLPILQRGYIPARLSLKRDTSGGAGQVSGDISQDQTVAETPIWFQPDLNQARGDVQFTHVFDISPGDLYTTPGSTDRFYAVLQVDDSMAPTRQLSTGVQYTQMLPIRAVNTEIVRPELATEGVQPLRWHIRRNGETFLETPADKVALPLEDVLAKGGIGDYSIVLEAEAGGTWVVASNEVSVKLEPPPTETPRVGETPAPGSTLVPGELALVSPTPTLAPPPTPTRRSPPSGPTPELTPGVSASRTPTTTATITPTRIPGADVFWADSYALTPGSCTTLHWNVQNVVAVYLDGQPVTGVESRQICLTQSTTYTLRVATNTGSQNYRITIIVGNEPALAFQFTADKYQLAANECTVLRWQAQGVRAVYLNDKGVGGEESNQVCPSATTTYTLRVVGNDGASSTKTLTVAVGGTGTIPMRFWAEQYTLSPGTCTTLHWSVEGVETVKVGQTDQEEGVPGVSSSRECPDGPTSYTMKVTASGGRSDSREIILNVEEPLLGPDEVIAQGTVREVRRTDDVDPTIEGEQPGWNVVVDGLSLLFAGSGDCCQAAVTLQVRQELVDQPPGFGVPVDWPINPGQLVEFRAICSDGDCSLQAGPPLYVRLRSQ